MLYKVNRSIEFAIVAVARLVVDRIDASIVVGRAVYKALIRIEPVEYK